MDYSVFANDIQNVIKNVAKSNGIKKYELGSIETNAKGDGFLAKIFMVTLNAKNTNRKLNLVIKFAFKEEKLRKSIPIRQSFENEIYFYSTINPALEDFRRTNGCLLEEYNLVVKCYHTSLKTYMELLVLENLKFQEFKVFDKRLNLTNEHFELIFERYGYFHAHSLALKDQNYPKFSQLVAPLKNIYKSFSNSSVFNNNMIIVSHAVKRILTPGKDDGIIKAFSKYLVGIKEIFLDSINDGGKYSTILHGDCWSNNMLFKYDKSGKPIDIRLIDWQVVKIGSPVCDLAYSLYSDGSKTNLDKLDHYLRIYHNSLSTTLKKLGSNPDKILTFKELKKQWKIYSKFGFILGMMLIRSKCIYPDDLLDFQDFDHDTDNTEVFLKKRYDNEKFEKTVYHLVRHMFEIGAL